MNTDELRAIAEAATRGNWSANEMAKTLEAGVRARPELRKFHDTTGYEADGRFIATFDPPTVLALLDRIATLESERAADKARVKAELAEVREALKPTPAAIAFALPLTNELDEEDWRIGDEACAMLDCVNTDGELAAAQLCRDYRNVADFLARAILRPGGVVA